MKERKTNEDRRKQVIMRIMQIVNDEKRIKKEKLIAQLYVKDGISDDAVKRAISYMEVLGYIVVAADLVWLPAAYDAAVQVNKRDDKDD